MEKKVFALEFLDQGRSNHKDKNDFLAASLTTSPLVYQFTT